MQHRHINTPRPGFFKLRAWRRGPWKPASIFRPPALDPDTLEPIDRWPPLQAEIADEPANVMEVWTWGHEITEKEYKWTRATWAVLSRPMPP